MKKNYNAVFRFQIHKSAREIVEELVTTENGPRPKADLPSLRNITRATNRARSSWRPKHPTDLDFEASNIYKTHFKIHLPLFIFNECYQSVMQTNTVY